MPSTETLMNTNDLLSFSCSPLRKPVRQLKLVRLRVPSHKLLSGAGGGGAELGMEAGCSGTDQVTSVEHTVLFGIYSTVCLL